MVESINSPNSPSCWGRGIQETCTLAWPGVAKAIGRIAQALDRIAQVFLGLLWIVTA